MLRRHINCRIIIIIIIIIATLSGVPGYLLTAAPVVLNAAACLVSHARKYDHVTHLLRDLHWLRVPGRIHYQLAVLVFRCRHNMAPPYLARNLRSTDEAEALQRLPSGSRQRLHGHAVNATSQDRRPFISRHGTVVVWRSG